MIAVDTFTPPRIRMPAAARPQTRTALGGRRPTLRVGSRLGKYRLDKRIGIGGFAHVYAATDTLLGIKAALKIPIDGHVSKELIDEFRREAKMTMRLDHPNVLPIRDASFIDGYFVIVTPLAEETLDDRLKRRMSFENAHYILTQLIDATAAAHEHGIIHCDIKPENVMLFEELHARLGDFGIAKAARVTINAGGTGTLGYMAPEQAMGKPSTRSDVFSIGLTAYRTLSGVWPEFPYRHPLPGAAAMRRKCHPDLIDVIHKCIELEPRRRFRDAGKLSEAWEAVRLKAVRFSRRNRKRAAR